MKQRFLQSITFKTYFFISICKFSANYKKGHERYLDKARVAGNLHVAAAGINNGSVTVFEGGNVNFVLTANIKEIFEVTNNLMFSFSCSYLYS